ncbi:hypothetical protein [Zavarzinella formosa]|uniref:hypothetical protein n=1 Tax=Zavarzinella formosa TaxID=360055 RepID=UPI0002EBE613|nr:hypothetical protein [Zavarzinella formosa]
MIAEKKRRRRLLIILPLVFVGLFVYAAWPGKITHTVSPETTHATEPVNAEGWVDYVTALNTRLRGDITPEQNANILFWQAIGPRPAGKTLPKEYFQWLGHPAPPEKGEYLVGWEDFLKAKPPAPVEDEAARDDLIDPIDPTVRRDRAKKWPWAAANDPDTAAWVAKNTRPLATLAQASALPAYYNPIVPGSSPPGNGLLMSSQFPNVQIYRESAILFVCRAMMHLGTGRPDEAWRDLMTCHRLGRVMERGGTLIEYLVGVAIQSIAIQGETVFLSQTKLTIPQLTACRDDLGRLPPPSRVAEKIDLAERYYLLDAMQMAARTGTTSIMDLPELGGSENPDRPRSRLFSRSVNWDPAFQLANTWYDRCVAVLRQDDEPTRRREMAAIEQELSAMKSDATTAWTTHLLGPKQRGENIGKIIVGLVLPSLDKVSVADVRSRQLHHQLTVAFALAAYKVDLGHYPARLAELAPKYLPEIPKDIFTNNELTYRRTTTGYLLYSVGANHIDDQGRDRDSNPPGDDLPLEMPAKEPPPLEKPKPVDPPE